MAEDVKKSVSRQTRPLADKQAAPRAKFVEPSMQEAGELEMTGQSQGGTISDVHEHDPV